jgi:hypothetical protein
MTFKLGTQVQFYCRTIDNVEVFSSLFSVETVPRFFSAQREDQSRAINDMRTIFNLTTKLHEMRTAYFCSMYVANRVDGIVLIPDPLKRMERLGKSPEFISFMAGVRERYISFKEIIQLRNNKLIYEQVAEGL